MPHDKDIKHKGIQYVTFKCEKCKNEIEATIHSQAKCRCGRMMKPEIKSRGK